MPVTLEVFVRQLEDSGLVASDVLQELTKPQSTPQTAEDLARELVRQKRLTKFQVEEISRGKGKGLTLGNYVVLDKLGQGGMGMVLKAEHKRMKRLVALKVMSPAAVKTPDALKRFHREVEAAAKLEHPNIVAAYDADEANGTHFFVMQYVDGKDLSSLVKSKGPLPVDQAVNYILQAARGLEYAHQRGVIHRDIKPANLLVDAAGTVKILDMGLARIEGETGAHTELTTTGAVMGTVDYMAPEQALSTKHADARSDQYSLGISLWYLLTGKCAYDGDTMMAKLLAHRETPIPSLSAVRRDVPVFVDQVFRKMVAKQATDRYPTMNEVVRELEAGSSGSAPQPAGAHATADTGVTHFKTTGADSDQQTLAKTKTEVRRSTSTATAVEATSDGTFVTGDESEVTSTRALASTRPSDASAGRKRQGKTKRGQKGAARPWWQDRRVHVAGGVCAVLMVLAALFLPSSRGKLRVEILESEVVVKVPGTDLTLTQGSRDPVPMAAGQKTLRVSRGDVSFETESFAIKSGAETAVKVEVIANALRATADGRIIGQKQLSPAHPPVASTDADQGRRSLNTQPAASAPVDFKPKVQEWTPLFDGHSLNGWSGDAGVMSVENGILINTGQLGVPIAPGGDYENFEVEVDYRLENGGNSGLGICYSGSGDPAMNGLEIQMLDDDGYPNLLPGQRCGSVFLLAPATPGHFKRWPTWNHLRVVSCGDVVRVEMNWNLVVDTTRQEMLQVNSQHAGAGKPSGKICLFPHTGRSEYHNFRIRLLETPPPFSMSVSRDIPYTNPKHDKQLLDVYGPSTGKDHPVVVYVHGGGWTAGDKGEVQNKPETFARKGFVFVSVNYRLSPAATLDQILQDVSKAIRWTHDHASEYRGDPRQIVIMGWSAGAQLSALICTDPAWLKTEGLSLSEIKGCIGVDGDIYDAPLRIATVQESVANIYRGKFGDEESQKRHSSVYRAARGNGIPPFLLFYGDHPGAKEQSARLTSALKDAGASVQEFATPGKDHNAIFGELGLPANPATKVLFDFLNQIRSTTRAPGKQ